MNFRSGFKQRFHQFINFFRVTPAREPVTTGEDGLQRVRTEDALKQGAREPVTPGEDGFSGFVIDNVRYIRLAAREPVTTGEDG